MNLLEPKARVLWVVTKEAVGEPGLSLDLGRQGGERFTVRLTRA
jgi:hypothetical protein